MYTEINGQKLGVIKTDTFIDFFTEKLFFGMMDNGREQINHVCGDLVECLVEMMVQRGELNRGQVTKDEFRELQKEAIALVVNGLIQSGTPGIYNAIHAMYVRIGQLPKREPVKA